MIVFTEYSADLSEFSDLGGRICAQSCENFKCSKTHVRKQIAEDEPKCICEGKQMLIGYLLDKISVLLISCSACYVISYIIIICYICICNTN